MPYKIIGEKSGCFKVKDINKPSHIFSKHCQTKKQAQAQRVAIVLSEQRKNPKLNMKKMFV